MKTTTEHAAPNSLLATTARRLRQRPEERPGPLAPARLGALRPVDDEQRLLRVRLARRLVKENLRPVPAARGLAGRAVGVAQGAVVRGGRRQVPRDAVQAVAVCKPRRR